MKKKRRWLKRLIIIVSVILVFFIAASAVSIWFGSSWIFGGELIWRSDPRPDVSPIAVDTRNLSGFSADALYLVQMIEQVHPIFIIEGFLPENYAAVRDTFIDDAGGFTTQSEFILAAYRYAAMLQDGHMSGFNLFAASRYQTLTYPGLLQIDWGVHEGRLFLNDENGRTDEEVISIGGAPITRLWEIIDEHVFHENIIYRNWNLALYSLYSAMIKLAGGTIADNMTVITIESPNETEEIEVFFQMPPPPEEFTTMGDLIARMDFIIRDEMIDDDIFFIDLRAFILGCHIGETAARIEQAIENGVRKFIVDLRGNGGGDSRAGSQLLAAMGICVPSVGVIRRLSPLMIDTMWRGHNIIPTPIVPLVRGLTLFADGAKSGALHTCSANVNGVFVSVLTDNETYSSAMMMAYWVQDGGLGNIIGEPTRNSPSSFGDMLSFTLPYTGLRVNVSHARFMRPDATADQSVLWPDIMVDPADALETAIEYLRGRNGNSF